jgi:hypothetical protein
MAEAFGGHPYLSVQPKEGMALAFVHRIWHEGPWSRADKSMCSGQV